MRVQQGGARPRDFGVNSHPGNPSLLHMSSQRYDLIVIGSGPAGQKGAIAAAKLGKDVAIVDREKTVGGVRLHGGTVPSKTLREAILHLTGFRQRSFYGADYAVKDRISIADLQRRILIVIEREMAVMRGQFRRNGVALISGTARFKDPHTLEVEGPSGTQTLTAGHVLIACGTRPVRHPDIPFDGERVLVVDDTVRWTEIPRTLIVVGAGVIGLELASMFSALSVPVTVIEQRRGLRLLSDCGAPYLRGWRRHRLPGPGLDVDGAGSPGELPHVRPAREDRRRASAVRDLHHPGDLHGRPDRAPAHRR